MFKRSKSVLTFGAGALALGVLMFAAPRAAHALAATLVQVTNTVANPAIAQSPNGQAAQLVQLSNLLALNTGFISFSSVTGNITLPNYAVPANQSLVITAVDLSPIGTCPSIVEARLSSPSQQKVWFLPSGVLTHLEYPSGIVLPPASNPLAVFAFGGPPNAACTLYWDMHGYLTSN
jgi:hypothetical protein